MQCRRLFSNRRRGLTGLQTALGHHTSDVRSSRAGNHVRKQQLFGKHNQWRCLSLTSVPTVLLPPVVFTGLLISLWTYKCLMMIIFQNKIIYMPSMPPFSRSEKVEDYANQCKPVRWTEHNIRSEDGTKLKLLEGGIRAANPQKHIVIVYFQGNGSSLPPRLPYISNILKLLHRPENNVQYTVVALSYRGFWQSRGRPSQKGIELDAQAALKWVSEQYGRVPDTRVVIWGQSIGVGVATVAVATWMKQELHDKTTRLPVSGLLLETPFTSLNAMLLALYPQKFLPYRYLGPFLMSTWDSELALTRIGRGLAQDKKQIGDIASGLPDRLRVLLLEAGDDELVPRGDAAKLRGVCKNFQQIEVEHKIVPGALHTDLMTKGSGKKEIVYFLQNVHDLKEVQD